MLRISLISGVSAGGDIKYSDKKQESFRNFMNKIWNAARFVLMNVGETEILPIEKVKLTLADKWIITRLNRTIAEVTRYMDRYEVGLAANKLYDFIWSEFCDWYIELSKVSLYSSDDKKKQNTVSVLVRVLRDILKLAHPIIPFITDEIYLNLPEEARDAEDIMISAYPDAKALKNHPKDARAMEMVMDAIRAVRALRAETGVKPSVRTELYVHASPDAAGIINKAGEYLVKLASGTTVTETNAKPDGCTALVTSLGEIYIPMGELMDYDKEIERLGGELEKAKSELERANAKLANANFVAKAPKALVEGEREKIVKFKERIAALENKLNEIKAAAGK